MLSSAGFGFLSIAIGAPRYIHQAEILSLSLRRNMPGIPLAIVTDDDRLARYADILVAVDHAMPIAAAQKILLDRYSPFERTLFIDCDCVVTRPFHSELAAIGQFPFSPALERITPIDGTDEYLDDVRSALLKVGGTGYPKFNGGVYYFDKSPEAAAVFEMARHYYRDYRAYGVRHFDRSGPGDETVIALALANLNRLDLCGDAGRLMRTPTGLRGRLSIDPLGGGCSFEGIDGVVHPAICHFAGRYLLMPEYRLAEVSLRTGISVGQLGLRARWRATLAAYHAKVRRFSSYRIDGLKRRLRASRT